MDTLGYITNNIVYSTPHNSICNKMSIGVSAAISACLCGSICMRFGWSYCYLTDTCPRDASDVVTTAIGRQAPVSDAKGDSMETMMTTKSRCKRCCTHALVVPLIRSAIFILVFLPLGREVPEALGGERGVGRPFVPDYHSKKLPSPPPGWNTKHR